MTIAIVGERVALPDSARRVLDSHGALREVRRTLDGAHPAVPAYWPDAVDFGWSCASPIIPLLPSQVAATSLEAQ